MPARSVGRLSASLALVLTCLSAAILLAGDEPTPGRFALAILRRDGLILPFAAFDGNRWTNKWPAERATEIPISLADVPRDWWPGKEVATEWTAWVAPSNRTQRITVEAPVAVNVHCTRRVALRTNYVALQAPPPPQFQPYPKDGLASIGDVRIEPVATIAPDSADAAALAARVTDGVNNAETKRVRSWARQWKHPFDERQRAKVPFTLELLARTPGLDPATTVSYFEGIKKYPGFKLQRPDRSPMSGLPEPKVDSCDYLTFAGGWVFTKSKAADQKPSVGAELTNCTRERLAYVLPLGAIRTGGRLFWIVQTSGWDNEVYSVIEIRERDTRTVHAVMGGACG